MCAHTFICVTISRAICMKNRAFGSDASGLIRAFCLRVCDSRLHQRGSRSRVVQSPHVLSFLLITRVTFPCLSFLL